ncbi:MAG TPA: response regulator, partial [Erythrobacter sp.]|nr:response regulator [Erythrobacter sp.]
MLIIEDNALIALDLETQMEDLGCDVVGVAVTAAQAIDTARRT